MTHLTILELVWTQVWQLALLGIVVSVAFRILASNRPHCGHLLWAIVLVKCLIPPIVSSPLSPFSWIASNSPSLTIATFWLPAVEHKLENQSFTNQVQPKDLEWGSNRKRTSDTNIALASAQHIVREQNRWSSWVFGLWLTSITFATFWFLGRYILFQRWLSRAAQVRSPRVDQLCKELSVQLKLNRRVRTKILLQPIGPAVIGLFRPTILLPKLIVDRMSDSHLRTLIAHELVHIRRGDLFWALLQMIAGCVWWFHPLVWLANRKLSQESERSCDEETIVGLRCDVGAYARCLIDVLEQKHLLHVAPALPGVRPVQVTERRLERIMKIKHGGNRRNPKWLWIGWALVVAVAVPGARFGVSQQTDIPVPKTESKPTKASPTLDAVPLSSMPLRTPATFASPAVISVPSIGPKPLTFDFAFPVTNADSRTLQVFSFTMGLTR